MRIISPFHDYYDCIQAHGQDDDLIYFRNPMEIPHGHYYGRKRLVHRHVTAHGESGYVGFCGERYPFLKVDYYDGKVTSMICHSSEDVHQFAEQHLPKKSLEIYNKRDKDRKWRLGWNSFMTRDSVNHGFDDWEKDRKPDNLFEKYKAPIFIRYPDKTIINGSLKDIEFYRVLDPNSAFQEITMFLSNLALPEPSMLTITDEDLAASKGYDKFSFRKPPSKRKS